MTDGASDEASKAQLWGYVNAQSFGRDVPIHSIAFGKADETQLRDLSDASTGRLFRAESDLSGTLRSAKGYN